MGKDLKVTGPKGGAIIKRAGAKRIAGVLPGLVRRFGRVTVSAAAPKPKPPVHKPTKAELEAIIRAAIVRYCRWGIANEHEIHYAQTRPIPILKRRTLPLTTDCSGFATCAYADAGAADPNGNHYNGEGWTGTLLARGRRISLAFAKAGDLVVFGAGGGHHVVVLLEDGDANGGDPLVCSHGQEKGPAALRLSVEARYQPTPVIVLTYL